MSDSPQEWPNRKHEIIWSTVTVCILATLILIWRIVYGVMKKRKLLVCDYLLIIAAIMNISTVGLRFKTTDLALGRHILDPSIEKPKDIFAYMYYLYCSQVVNLIAMAVLKYSICSYLLVLKFSKVYTVIVWLSILMVTVFNLLLPFFGNVSCTPFEKNWNKALPGKCWYKGNQGITYMQGVSNCVTDVVYVVAPIIYLRTVQLPRRTQWGLRCVFLLGLVATACSVMKTIELSALRKTKDPTWDGVNLTIWSATELSVGILISSLPPLRAQFDRLFRRILPSTIMSKSKTPGGGSIPLYNLSKHQYSKPMGRSEDQDDGSSERHILPENHTEGVIMKTVEHEVTTTELDPRKDDPFRNGSPDNKFLK
ncbi:hypothetical protein BU24DRAFT_376734 [Aaosphaeria arxii CBS 175.79]|uniref:Rhodopsin domain-containing protein n=1 Tax=Aaosphaeria arxii CBS 175.79 TaxID=1450172 RepID=A0A6A5XF75_9PLEO|nr:uncharacterized protein BU24DRAFT_376734 [Aaosphaeria arxii CBS 175.79]KAF2011511.1 hypothetical protein BU24DRAFT_376734 [Aaosphaeria arxii CBS 175.79]